MKDFILSIGYKDGTQKVSVLVNGENYADRGSDSIDRVVESCLKQLDELEVQKLVLQS